MKPANPTALLFTALLFLLAGVSALAEGLDEVKARGSLRHLGIPYANFITSQGEGMDAEIMRKFAAHLGVRYEFVQTDWKNVITDLTGIRFRQSGQEVTQLGSAPMRGDLIANGLTRLPWREKLVDFSDPTFPTGVWLVTRAQAGISPIRASGSLDRDIALTKSKLNRTSTLVMESTCLDPGLYDLKDKGLDLRYYTRSTNLNEMVPAILNNDAESTLLDVADALIALEKWPGQIKVVGPISEAQFMGVAFRKDSPRLRAAFNAFLKKIREDGTYHRLVARHYPSAMRFFPEFFEPARK